MKVTRTQVFMEPDGSGFHTVLSGFELQPEEGDADPRVAVGAGPVDGNSTATRIEIGHSEEFPIKIIQKPDCLAIEARGAVERAMLRKALAFALDALNEIENDWRRFEQIPDKLTRLYYGELQR